jgi:hypothetical protein
MQAKRLSNTFEQPHIRPGSAAVSFAQKSGIQVVRPTEIPQGSEAPDGLVAYGQHVDRGKLEVIERGKNACHS